MTGQRPANARRLDHCCTGTARRVRGDPRLPRSSGSPGGCSSSREELRDLLVTDQMVLARQFRREQGDHVGHRRPGQPKVNVNEAVRVNRRHRARGMPTRQPADELNVEWSQWGRRSSSAESRTHPGSLPRLSDRRPSASVRPDPCGFLPGDARRLSCERRLAVHDRRGPRHRRRHALVGGLSRRSTSACRVQRRPRGANPCPRVLA